MIILQKIQSGSTYVFFIGNKAKVSAALDINSESRKAIPVI